MNDYARIAKVIEYLDTNHTEQPSLAKLASLVGLSESHFHRLFRRWAGVTPKDFLQCLTAEDARNRLRNSSSVLDASLDSGLSGPGRLHDLMVTMEAATPGEIRSGGQGLQIHWGIAETPFGWATIGWSDRGICHLGFHEVKPGAEVPSRLCESWPQAQFTRDRVGANKKAQQIFSPSERGNRTLAAFVRGTEFQLRVWRSLLQIPEGDVVSYGKLAELVDRPGAARAVGTACGANPVGYLIPCHRVIRETGIVRGYRWGTERKQALLAWEGARTRLL